jgi:hypothetical protein
MPVKKFSFLLMCASSLVMFNSCKTPLFTRRQPVENTEMVVNEKMDVINYAVLKEQMAPSLAERNSGLANRGLLSTAVSIGTNLVKQMIARDRARYTGNYAFGATDLYFYDQLSTESVFDPIGMQFKSFTVVRTFYNKEGLLDTAMKAEFELDMTNPNEIINNSIFRIKLKDIEINYPKAKVTRRQHNDLNLDVEITFTTSFVNQQGQLFDNVELGKFYLFLRNAPLDKNSANYESYYSAIRGQRLDGKSFIVPRSFGYYKNPDGEIKPSYSQGAYSISAKVTETSRDRFVTKILVDNSSQLIDMLGNQVKRLDRR